MRSSLGHREAMNGAVGRMAVDDQVWIPRLTDTGLHEPHLGTFLTHIVTVQVDAGSILPRTHAARRANLAAKVCYLELAMFSIDEIVAIGIEQRHHEQGETAQKIAVTITENVAHQHQRGLLALYLAGMNSALNQHDGKPGAQCLPRREVPSAREYEQRQCPSFRCFAEIGNVQAVAAHLANGLDELEHIRVRRCLSVSAAFGACQRRMHGVTEPDGLLAFRRSDPTVRSDGRSLMGRWENR